MKGKYYTLFVLSLLVLGCFSIQAQDFVYQPVNPAFGGYYYNYQWLLSSAQAQNTYEGQQSLSDRYTTPDPLTNFQESMNRQILSQLSRQVMQAQFGETLREGTYQIGSYEIEVTPGESGININILDTYTGNETTVTVPYY
jgi:curli production assembly/transport component CsgF